VVEQRVGLLGVGLVGAVVPGVDEGLGRDLLTVVEGVAVLQLDRPDLVVLALDRRRHVVDDLVVRVQLGQAREEGVDDLAALGLVRVARDQAVLRLTDLHRDDAIIAARAAVATATTGRRTECHDRSYGHPLGAVGTAHGFLLMSQLVHRKREHMTHNRHRDRCRGKSDAPTLVSRRSLQRVTR
jgi:hypothetical protein